MGRLKTEREVREILSRRLLRGYAEHVAGVREDWPYDVALGKPSKQEILAGFVAIDALVQTLRAWEDEWGVVVSYEMREAGGLQRLPARVRIPRIDVAAELALPREGVRWSTIINRTERRAQILRERFPKLEATPLAKVLRGADGFDDLQFDLLVSAGAWFRTHDARGSFPREVPLPGIDGKWLNTAKNRSLVCLLAGKDELGLAKRPQLVEYAYLDPAYLTTGARRFDSYLLGDTSQPAYVPAWVLIVENRDTYISFPPMEGGVCLFGAGNAGMALVSEMAWVREAHQVFYWGDLDADGFEILDGYRSRDIRCASILMDRTTLERYGKYGTRLEKDHRTTIVRVRKELPTLTDEERAAYDLITSESYTGNVRLEQEKIPLGAARQQLEMLL